MNEECLICRAPLEYLTEDIEMECVICHKKEMSKTRCVNGHYVCSECHTKGIDSIFGVCLCETSKDPVEILSQLPPPTLNAKRWGLEKERCSTLFLSGPVD